MLAPGLVLAGKLFPGVGGHDQPFLLVLVFVFLLDAIIWGLVLFAAWRALQSFVW
jgi:hypothetical protein